jgi:hypothetical protein
LYAVRRTPSLTTPMINRIGDLTTDAEAEG